MQKYNAMRLWFTIIGVSVVSIANGDWQWSGSGNVSEDGNGVTIVFPASGYLPPYFSTVVKQVDVSAESGIVAVRIAAETGQPMAAMITVKSGTDECFCYVTDEMPGEGNTRTILLTDDAAAWAGNVSALSNPQSLAVYIRQGGTDEEIYRIENLFVGSKPLGNREISVSGDDSIQMRWEHLNSALCYDILKTENLASGQWEVCGTIDHPEQTGVHYEIPSGMSDNAYYKLRIRGD